ncbi:TlyA family RNA methyltransferase [Candidatus Saccharibacteria bacterium]|nr:TlyA family RNA methyltransferase [Candidatus Saccharibacteria bacterium]
MSLAKRRLDLELAQRRLVATRSQAESYIKLGKVRVNNRLADKPGQLVSSADKIELTQTEQYVSRAALKLASVSQKLGLDFKDKVVLDVGSSTGGFTDYALQHDSQKVIAVDVGTDQLHPSLRSNQKIDLHEKTDIRDFVPAEKPDIALIDVSFISLRQVLPAVAKLSNKQTQIIAMLKPQFEAGEKDVNKGIIKNDSIRRQILKDFELWAKEQFVIKNKADSEVAGTKGNRERFYLLTVR